MKQFPTKIGAVRRYLETVDWILMGGDYYGPEELKTSGDWNLWNGYIERRFTALEEKQILEVRLKELVAWYEARDAHKYCPTCKQLLPSG